MHQADIHHGDLVDDDHVRIQRIGLVALKMHPLQPGLPSGAAVPIASAVHGRGSRKLQEPVDGPGLIACGLGHPLGRPACGGCQKDLHILLFKIPDDRVDGGGLSGSRPSGDNKEPVVHRFDDRLLLMDVQLDLLSGHDGLQPLPYFLRRHRIPYVQIVEHSGGIELHIVKLGRIDDHPAVLFLHHQLFFHL